MKYILLLRHAKSSHGDSSLKDFDRPLAPRGKEDAPRMGQFLKDVGMLPGIVISSTAKRAMETTEFFANAAGIDQEQIVWNEDLYYGSSGNYLQTIQNTEEISNTILLVGHNPKMEDIARCLCGNGSVRMPTAALACFEQPANEWSQIKEGLALLKWMMIPQILKKIGRE